MALSSPRKVSDHLRHYIERNFKNVEVRDSLEPYKECERCLVATRDFRQRDLVLEEDGYVCIPVHTQKWYSCCHCLQFSSNPEYRCPICATCYCSLECKEADCGDHERHCKLYASLKQTLDRVKTTLPSSATAVQRSLVGDEALWRLVLRVLLASDWEKPDTLGFSDVANLCGDSVSFRDNAAWMQNAVAEVSEDVRALLEPFSITVSVATVARVFYRVCCNKYAIRSSRMQTNGCGLFVVASFVNHSCQPNTVASFVGRRIRFYATRGSEWVG